MIGSSKILTVSYGTFSCTLEGFDDSFETMKAIAEYFRDLAADDRYFGAEPPQPDAGALAQIAAQNTRGRVQALTSDSGVTLRAAPVDEPIADTPLPEASDSISAKLARIRDVVGRRNVDPEVDEAADPEPVQAQDDMAVNTPTAAPPAEPAAAPPPLAMETVAETAAEANVDEAPENEDTPDVLVAEPTPEPEIDEIEATADEMPPQSDADDSAVAENPADEDPAEESPAETDEPATPDLDPDVADLVLEALSAEADTLTDQVDPTPDATDDTENRPAPLVLNDLAEPAPAIQKVRHRITAQPKPKPALAWPQDPAFADFSQDLSGLSSLPDVPPQNSAAESEPDNQDSANSVLDNILDTLDTAPESEPKAEQAEVASDETADEAEPIRARITRVRRTALDDDIIDAEPSADTPDSIGENLADLDGLPEPETSEPLRLENEVEPSARPDADMGDPDVTRLMDQADAEMNEPAGNRRRQAIAHLKAAVAATEAARRLGDPVSARGTRDQAFRDDLDTLVRPRRPLSGGGHRTERPETPVAHDISRPVRSSGPVSPRRVSDASATAGLPEKFADYCRAVGATTTETQIEAALAFLIDVDNQDYVTRPWVIALVRDMDEASFDRESALRAFGSLLRERRMQDLGQRRFGITEKTRYRLS